MVGRLEASLRLLGDTDGLSQVFGVQPETTLVAFADCKEVHYFFPPASPPRPPPSPFPEDEDSERGNGRSRHPSCSTAAIICAKEGHPETDGLRRKVIRGRRGATGRPDL